jgi:hypothetical protein
LVKKDHGIFGKLRFIQPVQAVFPAYPPQVFMVFGAHALKSAFRLRSRLWIWWVRAPTEI